MNSDCGQGRRAGARSQSRKVWSGHGNYPLWDLMYRWSLKGIDDGFMTVGGNSRRRFLALGSGPNALLNSNSTSRSWASAHTDQGRRKRASLGTLRFFCCEIEAAQGRNGRVPMAMVLVAKCRRLGGSLSSGFEPLVSNHSLGVTSERDLLAFTPNLSIQFVKQIQTSLKRYG